MTEFAVGSPYTKNLGKELLVMLLHFGINLNYHNLSGFTPLMEAVKNKLRSL